MSEFREDLLASTINKKRLVKIIFTAVLLVTSFAFSVFLFSLLWGTQRPLPSDRLSEAEDEDVILMLPPFPYNMSDFQDQFSDLNLTQDQLQDLLDALQDMFDGDIDDLDLGNYSQTLASLMFSEVEVFRLYDYNDFNEMTTKLWKYECFDEYTGDGWHSTAAKQPHDFYSDSDYLSYHSDKDIIKLKMPLSPTVGINSMVIPNLFPTPFIMNGSLMAKNMDNLSTMLYQDNFNCTTVDLPFYDSGDVNMSYELFGLNLPTNDQINSSAIHASYTPLSIQNIFLQLPPSIQVYLANNPFVYNDYLALNNSILPNDSAFIVANKIRNYLQYQFTLPSDLSSYTTAPQGRDVVDYFSETREGLWSEFASAFCVFNRIFGVASRFVDGFNSLGIEEMLENGQNTTAIKYKNMYNWAEIFIPTDISGNGQWVQMDVLFDGYGVGGNPWSPENYSITVITNFTEGFRSNQDALITATLSQYGAPLEGETITFIDLTTEDILGYATTDFNGNTSITIPIDNNQVVGPHYIGASYNPQTFNYTSYDIYGNVQVQLTNISPQSVNLSISTFTNIQGYVVDPLNNIRVRNAQIELVLLNKGTNTRVLPTFIPNFWVTGPNGDFDMGVDVDLLLSPGECEVRVDFNSTFFDLINFSPFSLPLVSSSSSNRIDFNVTKGIVKKVWFYINNIPSDIPDSPVVNRLSTVVLKAKVVNETNYPLANQDVIFYDYTRGIQIGSNTTNVNGITTLNYPIGTSSTTGPNLLYAKIGIEENYTYFILNEEPTINILSGPTPREINRTGAGASNTIFNMEGEILDKTNNNPIKYSELNLKLLKGGTDYSTYLMPSSTIWTDFNGYFNFNFEVASNTPTGNYTLRLDFNGTIDYNLHPVYPTLFNLPYINTSSTLANELKVTTLTTLLFNFWINDTTFDDYYQPVINRNGNINLSVYLEWGDPLDNEDIDFYDLTQDIFLGTVQTNNGRASLIYNTNASTVAGPHLIYAKWGSNYNYSYFTLNDNITLDVQVGPSPNQINRGGETFTLQGTISDASNGKPIKFTEIYIALFDDTMTDVSYYLSSNWFQLDDTGTFDLTLSVDSGTPAINFTINVGFYGVFIYSFPNNQFNEFNFYFDILTYSNFTSNDNGNFELKVIDPDDITIQFWVDDNPALSFYNIDNLPERYNPGEFINFSVYVTQSGSPVSDGTVTLTDVYINSQIGSHPFELVDNGRWDFVINSSSWHAGLHKIKIQWSTFPAYNTTFVIINETINISAFSNIPKIQRSVDTFNIYGSVQDGTTNLNGLDIKILLFDSSMNDVSYHLNLAGSQTINVFDGSYQFDVNSISINCPQGQYYFRIDFNGTISQPGIYVTNYLINRSSILVPVNITAGTYIVGNYDTTFKDGFYQGDELYAYGYLYWDNGSLITGSRTITITIEDGGIIKTETGSTDGSGWFNITVSIDTIWEDWTEIWANFYPEDSFTAPANYYIEFTEIELFRP